MVRFIHSSDLHLGKRFGNVTDTCPADCQLLSTWVRP